MMTGQSLSSEKNLLVGDSPPQLLCPVHGVACKFVQE